MSGRHYEIIKYDDLVSRGNMAKIRVKAVANKRAYNSKKEEPAKTEAPQQIAQDAGVNAVELDWTSKATASQPPEKPMWAVRQEGYHDGLKEGKASEQYREKTTVELEANIAQIRAFEYSRDMAELVAAMREYPRIGKYINIQEQEV